MSWFTHFVDQVKSADPIGGNVMDWMSKMPGTPEAFTKGLAGGMSNEYSWNPYNRDGPATTDVWAGGKFSSNEEHRRMGRGIGTAIGMFYGLGALGAGGSAGGGGAAAGEGGATVGAGEAGTAAGSGLAETGSEAYINAGGMGGGGGVGASEAAAGAGGGLAETGSEAYINAGNMGAGGGGFWGNLGNSAMSSLGNMSLMDWGRVGIGAYGLYGANQQQRAAQAEEERRRQYQQRIDALTANPNQITSMPGYQAGLEAVQRSMAAQGFTGSGNMMAALAKYGGDFYQQQLNNLTQQAGGMPAAQAIAQQKAMALSNQMSSLGLMTGGFGGNQATNLQALLRALGYQQGA